MSSFLKTLERIDRSIRNQERTHADLVKQRELVKAKLDVPSYAALDRKLRLHQERVEKGLHELSLERMAVAELVEKSPELPMEDPGRPKRK